MESMINRENTRDNREKSRHYLLLVKVTPFSDFDLILTGRGILIHGTNCG
jgi:hypothetical protein